VRSADTTPAIHALQVGIYRRLGPAGCAALAASLSDEIREVTRAGIAVRHPDYAPAEVEMALRRLLFGDDLFRRAWPADPLLSP
jgi:hypothetical protein